MTRVKNFLSILAKQTLKRAASVMSDPSILAVLLFALCNTALALMAGSGLFIVSAALCWASFGCVVNLSLLTPEHC